MRFGILALAALLPLAACGKHGAGQGGGQGGGVTEALLAHVPDSEWPSYGRDPGEQRFSPLDAINDRTIGRLGLAWYSDLETARGQEATPLMHDGVLYVSTAWSMVKAYDARTGAPLWSYDPQVPRETLARACCDAVNRGVALYGDKVFVGTLDGRLVALDARTGHVVWSVVAVPDSKNYTITGAPRIAKGLVLIGSGGGEYRARGFLAAYDPATGRQVWRFHTVPGNPADGFAGEGANRQAMADAAKSWSGQWWKLGGGGTVWDSITYDPATNLVLFGTGNAEPWNPAPAGRTGAFSEKAGTGFSPENATKQARGDTLYTASIVALDADTGAYRWHFKETPEDRWDFDSDAQIALADLTIGGARRHVALHAPKNGYFYAIDAKTGAFISAGSFAAQNWTTGIDPKTGRPTIAPAARYEKTGKPFIGLPGAGGAHSWQPMSFSPKTGLVYLPANLAAFPYAAAKGWQPSVMGFQTGIDLAATAMPANTAVREGALAATTGALIAWDPVAQKPAWTVHYATPWNGGTLATAGNLVFAGDATGHFHAYSADKGREVWAFPVETGVMAAPMTYAIDGEQYVAVLAGWGGVWDIATGILAHKGGLTQNIGRLLVFKLGGTAKLPPPATNRLVLDPPAFKGTLQQAQRGAGLYGRYCAVCHGDAAIAGMVNPDLRHSAALGAPEAVQAIVIGGALQQQGMVSFKAVLTRDDAEAIRQYLVKRANEDKALGMK